ncbi:MAG: hypothetical protein AB8F95_03735 [Bacteroidia bacterium]
MAWHHPTSSLTTAASEGWAFISSALWRASWLDENGDPHKDDHVLEEGARFADSVLDRIVTLRNNDFPVTASLYVATPECILAPKGYKGNSVSLMHTILDDTIPASAIQTYDLDKPASSIAVFSCSPALQAVWNQVAPQGKVIPLVERDLQFVFSKTEANLMFIHILAGYVQVSVKQANGLTLCNAFRYQESEEANLMLKGVIQHFFQENVYPIYLAGNGGTRDYLLENLPNAHAVERDHDFWTS